MGLFRRSIKPSIPPVLAEPLSRVADRIGVGPITWRGEGAEFVIRGAQRLVPTLSLQSLFPSSTMAMHDSVLGLKLAELLGVVPPPESLADFETLRPFLRPRLEHRRELTGPRRTMCRREVFGDLLEAVAIGSGPGSPLVTSAHLDVWGTEFEPLRQEAVQSLTKMLGKENLREVEDADGVLALVSEAEQAASGALILDHIAPIGSRAAEFGVVFSVPHDEVLLLLPIIPNAGPGGLAAIVQATFTMAGALEAPLSDQVFWWRSDAVEHLPMTSIEEGTTRRVHLEAKGPIEELLRILGAID